MNNGASPTLTVQGFRDYELKMAMQGLERTVVVHKYQDEKLLGVGNAKKEQGILSVSSAKFMILGIKPQAHKTTPSPQIGLINTNKPCRFSLGITHI